MSDAIQPAFDLENVTFAYDRQIALNDITLQIGAGEQVALLGANGSGKSTLLRVLGALAFPASGRFRFFGQDITEDYLRLDEPFFQFRRRVGIVFQNPDVQLFNASVFDEVAFGPLHLRWPKEQVRDKVEQTLVSFGIADLRHRAPHRLSGGEKKRVAIASVMVTDPDVFLLDEPTAALDPASHESILDLLASWRGTGRTVITATHELDTVERLAHRCCVLCNGRLTAMGDSLDILHDTALLQRAGLVRVHSHVHASPDVQPHPHIHRSDVQG